MKKELSAIALGMLLAGCGGSSGGDGDRSDSPSESSTPTVFADVVYYSPKCAIERPAQGIRFIVHDEDGDIIREQTSDAQGHVELDWDNGEAHLTTLRNTIDENGEVNQSISTAIDLKHGDLGKVSMSDVTMNQQCECESFEVDYSQITQAYSDDYIVTINGSYNDNQNSHVVESCKINGIFEPISLVAYNQYDDLSLVYAARLEPTGTEENNTFQVKVEQLIAAEQIFAETNQESNWFTSFASTPFGIEAWHTTTNDYPLVFNALYFNNYIQTNTSSVLAEDEQFRAVYRSLKREKVDDLARFYDLNLPDNSVELLTETQNILQGLNSNTSASYNLSKLTPSYDRMFTRLTGNGLPIWRIVAPISGVFPELDLPSDIQSQLEESEYTSLYISIAGHNLLGNIDEYRKLSAESSREAGFEVPSYQDFIVHESITLTMK